MANPLVECIPNFSEGRNMSVIDQIKAAITSIAGVKLLDCHCDRDHNRTVLTIIGAPQPVKNAAFQAVRKAAELIDMDQHKGEHPRLGATDVVPFVPIRDVNLSDCVELARELGRQVGEELEIPVYLYESAANCPERINLEDVRRGQYEGLKEEITSNPARLPDFGPAKLGKAGATIIGAREALIALNVYLASDDVEIAKKIAKTVRFSSGGLRYVKAMGVLVDGRAQVSMNLTNFRKTSIPLVCEMIRREAQRYGTAIHHSELVGLIPQEAILEAAAWYLQLEEFSAEQVLENLLRENADQTSWNKKENSTFLEDLANPAPTPGGGSAAAFSAAEAAALVSMVAGLTIGKKKYIAVEEQMRLTQKQARTLLTQLTEAIQADSQAFESLMQASRLPKETPEQLNAREVAIEKATIHAARVPLATAELALQVMQLAEAVALEGNRNAVTDAWSAAVLAFAAISAAGANVRINLSGMETQPQKQEMMAALVDFEITAADLIKRIRKGIQERAAIDLL